MDFASAYLSAKILGGMLLLRFCHAVCAPLDLAEFALVEKIERHWNILLCVAD